MEILQAEIYRSDIKLKEPFTISLGSLDHATNVFVVVRTSGGITGFGECSPFATINGETAGTCLEVGRYLGKLLLGKNPLDIAGCSAALDSAVYGNTSIKSAFDIALYDIASKHAGVPLYAFLGGRKNKTILTDYTVSIGDPQKMARDASKIKNDGFQIIKVKLGATKEKDLERIRLIREAVGMEIPLRIDANQGWKTEAAIEILKALAPYTIQHCEEPIPRWNFMELPKLRKNSPIPVMADESCFDEHDAERLINIGACDSINIKLGKSSGIYKALKIVRLAEQAGLELQVGGFLESRLGFTASAHLSLVSDRIMYYDFDTPLMLDEDPVNGGITYGKEGVVSLPETPGLGAEIDEKYLNRLPGILIK